MFNTKTHIDTGFVDIFSNLSKSQLQQLYAACLVGDYGILASAIRVALETKPTTNSASTAAYTKGQ